MSWDKTRYLAIFCLMAVLGTIVHPDEGMAKTGKKDVLGTPNVRVTRQVEKRVILKWKKISGASAYRIYRKSEGQKKFQLVKIQKKCSYTDTKAKANITYQYKVRAVKRVEEAGVSQADQSEQTPQATEPASGETVSGASVTSTDPAPEQEQETASGESPAATQTPEPSEVPVVQTTDKRVREVYGKYSKAATVSVNPKKPVVAVVGECFAQDFALYGKGILPKKTKVVYYIGINSYRLYHDSCVTYQGMHVTPLEKAAYAKPDRVYFIVGMNECKDGNVKATINNFKKMYQLLRRINSKIKVVMMAVPPTARTSRLNIPTLKKRRSWNQALKKYAENNMNFYYFDYTGVLDDGHGYLKKSVAAKDGCHWSVGGARAVIREWYKWDKKTFR